MYVIYLIHVGVVKKICLKGGVDAFVGMPSGRVDFSAAAVPGHIPGMMSGSTLFYE